MSIKDHKTTQVYFCSSCLVDQFHIGLKFQTHNTPALSATTSRSARPQYLEVASYVYNVNGHLEVLFRVYTFILKEYIFGIKGYNYFLQS